MEQIYADLIPGGKMPLLHASQYDEGREYRINLTENKQAYTLDGTELLSISVRKGDNTLFTADIANTFGGKSYVDFVSTEQMCAVAGFSFGELSISKNNTRIGTINFTLMVEPSPEEGGVSQSEINNLARQVEELVDDEMGDYLLKTEAEETYAKKTSLSTVATSGDYNDLLNKPSIPAPQVNSDWNADSGVSQILNKPNLATVATSGNYNDLSNKPTIPAAQVNSDWNSNSGVSQILNKPNLSTVATTGNYDDLNNKPTIPVIDDTTKVADKVWSSKKTFDEIVNILPTGNASGSIANFNTSLALPLVSAKFDFNATQEAGTPTPQSPKAISGVSAVNVIHCGKNLFDKNNANAILNAYIGTEIVSANTMRVVFAKCKPNTKYTVSKNAGQRFTIAYTKEIPQNGVAIFGAITNNTATSLSITTGSDAKYIVAFVYNANVDSGTAEDMLASVQIEEGNATTYEPYNGSTTLINLGGTYYGGYVSQDKNGKRELVVTYGELDLGDLSYIAYVYGGVQGFYSLSPFADAPKNGGQLLCSIYKRASSDSAFNGDGLDYEAFIPTATLLKIKNSNYTDANDFKTAMQGVILYYELAEPFTVELPDEEPIIAFNGVNNVYADSGDCEVTYKKSIDEAIAELQALILS